MKGEGNHIAFEGYGLDVRTGRRFQIDPLISKFPSQSSYMTFFNNPLRYTDPTGMEPQTEYELNTKTGEKTKVSDLGGDKVDYTHYYGGGDKKLDGKTKVENAKTGESQLVSGNGNRSLLMDYVKRNKDVDYLTITNEFFSGVGTINSLIYGTDHPMNKELINSPLFKNAAKDFSLTDMENKMFVSNEGEFGLLGAYDAGDNMTAQMLGKFGVSFYPIGDIVIVLVTDSKSKNSVNPIYKFSSWIMDKPDQHNEERKDGKYPTYMGNTRQSYLFELPKKYFKKK